MAIINHCRHPPVLLLLRSNDILVEEDKKQYTNSLSLIFRTYSELKRRQWYSHLARSQVY